MEVKEETAYTVKDIWGFKKKRGDVGIEIECEGRRSLPDVNISPWKTKQEGSLRHVGKEYITANPVIVNEDLLPAIRMVTDQINDPIHNAVKDSPRTSVHVHANVLGLTPTQVWTVATCYWLLENPLMEFCGPTRVGNRFCLRLKDAEGVLKIAVRDLKTASVPFSTMNTDRVRYSGLNLAAVSKFGSVEFRGMRGTTDPKLINIWSRNCWALVQNSVKCFKSPAEAMDFYFKSGPDAFAYRVLDSTVGEEIKYGVHGWREQVEESSGLLCELAYAHDWAKWESKLKAQGATAAPRNITANDINVRVASLRGRLENNGTWITGTLQEFAQAPAVATNRPVPVTQGGGLETRQSERAAAAAYATARAGDSNLVYDTLYNAELRRIRDTRRTIESRRNVHVA